MIEYKKWPYFFNHTVFEVVGLIHVFYVQQTYGKEKCTKSFFNFSFINNYRANSESFSVAAAAWLESLFDIVECIQPQTVTELVGFIDNFFKKL